MPHRKKPQKKTLAAQTPLVSPIFDTALPLSLRSASISTNKKGAPRINVGKTAPISPYVIRLSHEGQPSEADQKAKEEAEIQALMDQLLNADADLEKEEPESEVLVDFVDLMNQVREDLPEVTLDLRAPRHHHDVAWHSMEMNSSPLPELNWSGFDPSTVIKPAVTESVISSINESEETEDREPLDEIFAEEQEQFEEQEETGALVQFALPNVFHNLRYRMTAGFVALSLLFVLPIHAMQEFGDVPALGNEIVETGTTATDQLKQGGEALLNADYTFAADHFESAAAAFGDIEGKINEATKGIGRIASVIPQSARALRTTEGLVQTGESLSQVARLFARAVADIDERSTLSATEKIKIFEAYLEEAEPEIAKASEAVQKIDPALIPQEQQETVEQLLATVPALLNNVQHLREYLNASYTILGGDEQKSYLLIFQNNAELRATGGFMGSYAEVKIDEGKLTGLLTPKGGTYDIQGQMSKFVAPPKPLQLTNGRWEFQDANWFPDFRLSAKKMLEFHGAAGGPTMDGVIAINASVLPKLLAITGPITAGGKELNAENVLFELARRDDTPTEAPKELLSELTDALFKRLESADTKTVLAASDVLFTALSQQEVQLYMKDQALAELVHGLHWSGAQLPYSLDTLQVINSNIGGGKSDAVVDEHVDLQVNIEEDGSIINTVTITKTHRGIASSVLQGMTNIDYMRVYVPRGSQLLSAEGFDERPREEEFDTITNLPLELDKDLETTLQHKITDEASLTDVWEENGFTVFGNWVQTSPGETETVTLRYKLAQSAIAEDFSPDLWQQVRTRFGMKPLGTYSLVLQKQSGASRRETSVNVTYPPSWKKQWSTVPEELISNDTNRVIQALFERP